MVARLPNGRVYLIIVAASIATSFSILSFGAPTSFDKRPNEDVTSDSVSTDISGHSHGDGLLQLAKATTVPLADIEVLANIERFGDASLNQRFLLIDTHHVNPEENCEGCSRFEYTPGPNRAAAIVYSFENPIALEAVKRLTFWAASERGSPEVRFFAAGKSAAVSDSAIPREGGLKIAQSNVSDGILNDLFQEKHFSVVTESLILDKEWKKYEINLDKVVNNRNQEGRIGSPNSVTDLFGFQVNGQGGDPVSFYLKAVTIDDKTSLNPLDTIDVTASIAANLTATIISNSSDTATTTDRIEFLANVSGGAQPYSFLWHFGNGEDSRDPSVIYNFENPGEYNITLSVIDALNQSASDSLVLNISSVQSLSNNSLSQNYSSAADLMQNLTNNGEVGNNVTGQVSQGPSTVRDTSGEPSDEEIIDEQISEDTGNNTTAKREFNITDLEKITEAEEVIEEGDNSTLTNATDDSPDEQNNVEEQDTEPIEIQVNAGIDVIVQPGDVVILNGELTGLDIETEGLDLEWTQTSGPSIEIEEANTLNPRISIPNLEDDAEIGLEFAASLESGEDSDSIRLFVQHVVEILESQEESLGPTEDEEAEWTSECDNQAECMGDNSDSTFATASPKDVGDANLFSFNEFDIENAEIAYLTAIATARTDEAGYLLFVGAVDPADPSEPDGAVSITSDSFTEYEFVWKENPVTASPWTVESLNSFLAGYAYGDGSSNIDVSEFELIVTYTVAEDIAVEGESIEQDEESPTRSDILDEGHTEEEGSENTITDETSIDNSVGDNIINKTNEDEIAE